MAGGMRAEFLVLLPGGWWLGCCHKRHGNIQVYSTLYTLHYTTVSLSVQCTSVYNTTVHCSAVV